MEYEGRIIVICNKCETTHYEVSRKEAELEVDTFNKMFYSLPENQKKLYYNNKPNTFDMFERCVYCNNNYQNFRECKKLRTGDAHAILSRFE